MLKHLSIKNVAVIEKAEIDFENGFSVLTGETGAGKSIIIDAINMLKGERTSKGLIRGGETKARVDGQFETDEHTAGEIAEILGTDPECEIFISREMNSESKNTIRVNGIPVNMSVLKMIGDKLVNIHGQHDNTSLLSVRTHIGFLDRFGFSEIEPVLLQYRECNEKCRNIEEQINSINTDEQEKLRRRDLLAFQKEELEEADLRAGEDDELEARKAILDNSALISESTSRAYAILYGGDDANVHDMLWDAIRSLEKVADFSGEINDIYSSLSDIGYSLGEAVRELRSFCDNVYFDEEEAHSIDERLDVIYNMKRKYGSTIEAVLDFYAHVCEELEAIDTSDERAAMLKSELEKWTLKRTEEAHKLTLLRKKYAETLADEVMKQLSDLNMAKVEFAVEINESSFKEDGCDNVEFMVCTNVGESRKPLAKIASGGELSRIMLAIKNVLAGYDNVKTVIFDEVDTGVSGSAAQKIGEKLYAMSDECQVLCITHLPQIAALADNHYLIEKNIEAGRTLTNVRLLSHGERIDEIARTLGGAYVTDIAKENASQLLHDAAELKNNM